MNLQKCIVGSALLISSSILFSVKYLAASMFMIRAEIWGKDEFIDALKFTPISLTLAIYGTLIGSIVFLLLAFVEKK